jgi:hypothetical protein
MVPEPESNIRPQTRVNSRYKQTLMQNIPPNIPPDYDRWGELPKTLTALLDAR